MASPSWRSTRYRRYQVPYAMFTSGRVSSPGAGLGRSGREAMYRFCAERGIAHERCGKIVVANTYASSMEEQSLPANRFSETQGMFDPMLTPDGEEPPVYTPMLRSSLASPIGLGKVYVNDPIERVEGKPSRHNPNRK